MHWTTYQNRWALVRPVAGGVCPVATGRCCAYGCTCWGCCQLCSGAGLCSGAPPGVAVSACCPKSSCGDCDPAMLIPPCEGEGRDCLSLMISNNTSQLTTLGNHSRDRAASPGSPEARTRLPDGTYRERRDANVGS